MNMGVYSDEGIRSFIDRGIVKILEGNDVESQIQPSSFDLTVGGRFYCLPCSSLPLKGEKLENYFKKVSSYEFDISDGRSGFLHKGKIYVVKLNEAFDLPEYIAARANPKSSIGRVDLHVRLIIEGGGSFDDIPSGYTGEVWLELFSRSFDIQIYKGISLTQIRFFDSSVKSLSAEEISCLNRDCGIVYSLSGDSCGASSEKLMRKESLGMSVSVPESGFVGYIARDDAPSVDLSKRDLPASLYFDKVISKGGSFIVSPESFYILYSNEIINIPVSTCAEMLDIETAVGEFRGHYAGFFDPGFSAQAVLELRNYGQPFLLRDGQIVSGLVFFRMKNLPRVEYGASELGSNYQGQKGPRLAKFFDIEK